MRTISTLLILISGATATTLNAGPIITYQVSTAGSLYRYTYALSGFDFLTNQELDITFDPLLYGPLSNGVATAGYSLLLFQPNDPPSAQGDYSLLATTNHPSTTGIFSVDFQYWSRPSRRTAVFSV